MKRSYVLIALLFALALITAPASAFAFFAIEAGVGYWQQTPSGTLEYKPVTNTVGKIDLKDDMYFDKVSKPFVRIKAELPLILPNIYLMYTPMSFDGSGALKRTISYGGRTYNTATYTNIASKIKLDHTDLALFYPIPLLKTATLGKLNVELGLNIRKIDFEGTITGTAVGVSQMETKAETIYLPMIYAGIQVKPISLIALEVEGRFISVSGNSYTDVIGKLKVHPIPLVYIAGGIRSESLTIDAKDIKTDIKFSGPFLEAGLSF